MKQKQIDDIRSFNRFYTRMVGLLDQHILNSQFSLPEVRILFEIHHKEGITASEIISGLKIDKSYLSRILKKFEKKKMIIRTPSEADRRSMFLKLTKSGRKEFEILNQAANKQIVDILSKLSPNEREQLVESINSIKAVLSKLED